MQFSDSGAHRRLKLAHFGQLRQQLDSRRRVRPIPLARRDIGFGEARAAKDWAESAMKAKAFSGRYVGKARGRATRCGGKIRPQMAFDRFRPCRRGLHRKRSLLQRAFISGPMRDARHADTHGATNQSSPGCTWGSIPDTGIRLTFACVPARTVDRACGGSDDADERRRASAGHAADGRHSLEHPCSAKIAGRDLQAW